MVLKIFDVQIYRLSELFVQDEPPPERFGSSYEKSLRIIHKLGVVDVKQGVI